MQRMIAKQLKQVERGRLMRMPRPGRNHACNCGSGKKWKKCCGMSKAVKLTKLAGDYIHQAPKVDTTKPIIIGG